MTTPPTNSADVSTKLVPTPELLAELKRKAAEQEAPFPVLVHPDELRALVEEVGRLREQNAGLRGELIRERLGDDPGAEFCVMPQAAADELSELRAEVERLKAEILDERYAHRDHDALRAQVRDYEAALEFYAEPFTWARVAADALAGVTRFVSYGEKAVAALAKWRSQT